MIAIDTNIVIRFVTRDDESQFEVARSVLAQNECYLPVTVILEAGWVLENVYGHAPSAIARGLRKMMGLSCIVVDRGEEVEQALQWYEDGFDFADAFHRALTPSTADALATFDQSFIQQARGTEGCPVVDPEEWE